MNRIILCILILLYQGFTYGQSQSFIDSLKLNSENKIIVLKTNCVGCIVINKPCESYIENGNPWNLYIIWKNTEGNFIRKFNNCGGSNILTIKKWDTDPFAIVDLNTAELDTTKLKYPLFYNSKDSTWYETEINHYKYYDFLFPTDDIKELRIMDYAFRESKINDDFIVRIDKEFQKNQYRYDYNNKTVVKGLLDCMILIVSKADKNLKITNANIK